MNFRPFAHSARAAARSAAMALVTLCALGASRSSATCTYYGLDTTGTYSTAGDPTILELTQTQPTWSAIAVRPHAGDDWDLTLYQNAAASPACVANALAGSTYGAGTVDFVIGDYAHNPPGTYYAYAHQFSGVNPGDLRWTNSAQVLPVNGPAVNRSWGGTDVIETWNVSLTAGQNYLISFYRSLGIDAKVLLFGNPGGGTFWAGRPSALLTSTTATNFTAPTTGTYAVVVVNDDGGLGSFSLGIGACTPPVALTGGVPLHTNLTNDYMNFNQVVPYWTVVGVRSTGADYDLGIYGGTAGAGYPNCLSDLKASSTGVGSVDFVVGDFNKNPTGTYYAQPVDYSGPVGADVEWDSGSDQLYPNGVTVSRTTGPGDVIEIWDVFLASGQQYNFTFNSTGTHTHMLLFRNALAGTYWARRSSAEFDVTGCWTYTAPSSGYYGVVVVNDNGENADYSLGVSQYPCTCPVALSPQLPTSAPSPDAYYSFTQPGGTYFWSVVATRGFSSADDWDLTVTGAATGNAAPTCLGPPLISSAYGAGLVDVGVIDFNHVPLGTYYARTHHFSGAAFAGLMEWDWTHGELIHNGPYTNRTMTSNDLAHSWDAYMLAGKTYTIEFSPSDVTIKLMVFENAAGSNYMVTRSSAALLTSSTVSYTPTATGYHGFVVVNDQAVNGSYRLRYGSCETPLILSAGVSQVMPEAHNTYSFAQATPRWAGLGVRSSATDYDLRVSATQSGPFPDCIGGALSGSGSGSLNFVDFVVGDFGHNPFGTYYAQAYQFTQDSYGTGRIEWSPGAGVVLPNDNNEITASTDVTDVMSVWNVYMQAGLNYQFTFNHSGGANLHLLVFENAGGSTYWAPRAANVIDLTPGGGPFNYAPPTTGEYGIVVVNDDGGTDNYRFNIKTCYSPIPLASNVVSFDIPENFHFISQAVHYWTAIGVRSTSDWDIEANLSAGGGVPGVCQSGLLASSTGVGIADFVVGDFNVGANAIGTYFIRDHRFSGTGVGSVEWDGGADVLTVNGSLAHRATDSNDVLEIWDVLLTAGQTYAIYFTHSGAADVKVMLFRNPGGPYWAPRNFNVYSNTASGNFTAPASGFYGIVVVNDNGAAGAYDLGIYRSALAVQPGGETHVTALRSVQPNPARAGMHVEYALSQRAPVRVQMLDLAGRVVADMENGTREAGVWQAGWNGLTRTGQRAAPGVYMVRLEVDGRTIGQRKVTVLE